MRNGMSSLRSLAVLIGLWVLAAWPLCAHAADVAGVWKAEFDTQIGVQKYTFTFKLEGGKLTGKANSEASGEKHETELTECKLEGDTISFVENLQFQGNEVRITYKGKVADNEMKLTRNVMDIIPFVESKYSVKTGAENRAIAGLSMGGGQSLNFGMAHLDTFAWVGGFSSAPNTRSPAELVPDPNAVRQKLKLLWVSCGDRDGLIYISQGVHAYLKEKSVPHIWHVDSGAHEWPVWKNELYLFSQRIFR
jgi:hypothetical protein